MPGRFCSNQSGELPGRHPLHASCTMTTTEMIRRRFKKSSDLSRCPPRCRIFIYPPGPGGNGALFSTDVATDASLISKTLQISSSTPPAHHQHQVNFPKNLPWSLRKESMICIVEEYNLHESEEWIHYVFLHNATNEFLPSTPWSNVILYLSCIIYGI